MGAIDWRLAWEVFQTAGLLAVSAASLGYAMISRRSDIKSEANARLTVTNFGEEVVVSFDPEFAGAEHEMTIRTKRPSLRFATHEEIWTGGYDPKMREPLPVGASPFTRKMWRYDVPTTDGSRTRFHGKQYCEAYALGTPGRAVVSVRYEGKTVSQPITIERTVQPKRAH